MPGEARGKAGLGEDEQEGCWFPTQQGLGL